MRTSNLITMLKPNIASLGYALFLAVNAACVWGGVFPFLPLEFQTPRIVASFFIAQSLTFFASYLASAVGVYFLPQPTRRFLVKLTSTPYALGWCCLIAAMYLDRFALPLVIAGGLLVGLGSAGFYMLWQRLFASQNPETGVRDLVMGFAYGAIFYFALHLIPRAVTALLIPLVFLPLFGLCITLRSRTIAFDQPMFEDIPREHPHVYAGVMRTYWRSALAAGIIGFCAGIMRALAVADPQVGSLVNILSMVGMLIASIALLLTWYFRSLHLNVESMYHFAFPFIVTSFLLLPILPSAYARWLAAVLYALYSSVLMLTMIQCSQIAHDRGVNPVFVYGFFGTIVYALHDLGFISGMFAENMSFVGLSPLGTVAIVAVYLLAIMHFIGTGGFGKALGRKSSIEPIEFMAMRAEANAIEAPETKGASSQSSAAAKLPSPAAASREATSGKAAEAADTDRIAQQAQALREHYRLSARETEIMELIARGNTVARIAEMLVVSENTVRTHSKRIYTKLDIHKKQELIDLIDSFHP